MLTSSTTKGEHRKTAKGVEARGQEQNATVKGANISSDFRHDNMRQIFFLLVPFCAVVLLDAFQPSTTNIRNYRNNGHASSKLLDTDAVANDGIQQNIEESEYWKIAPSMYYPEARVLPTELREAMAKNRHPEESQEDLGKGISILQDWRENWFTYESPLDHPDLIDPHTGFAEYECEVEGDLPSDLIGTLYRNGPGKFGIDGERVQHVLDADALVYKIEFPPLENRSSKRKIKFLSRFVLTEHFEEERKANKFLYRGTFGTGPSSEFFDSRPKTGLNDDPIEPSPLSKVVGGAFNTKIKNSANTQIISFGGKVLALFEAGLPHRLDPISLATLGEDTMNGSLKSALPVKLGKDVPSELIPDFIGGHAVRSKRILFEPTTNQTIHSHF